MNAYETLNIKLEKLDIMVNSFMNKWGVTLLRYSLGIIVHGA